MAIEGILRHGIHFERQLITCPLRREPHAGKSTTTIGGGEESTVARSDLGLGHGVHGIQCVFVHPTLTPCHQVGWATTTESKSSTRRRRGDDGCCCSRALRESGCEGGITAGLCWQITFVAFDTVEARRVGLQSLSLWSSGLTHARRKPGGRKEGAKTAHWLLLLVRWLDENPGWMCRFPLFFFLRCF